MSEKACIVYPHAALQASQYYKLTVPELTLQPDTASNKICQKSDKTWCCVTRWHTLRLSDFSDTLNRQAKQHASLLTMYNT